MAALARATALAAPVVAPRGVARRSTGARVPSMASRVPSANLAASLRSVGGKQVRIARQNRARGVPAKLDPSKPSTTGVLFQRSGWARGAARRRDAAGPIDLRAASTTTIESDDPIARVGDRFRSRPRARGARPPPARPCRWGSPRDVSVPSTLRRRRHARRGVPSPFPSPKPRSSLTATILPTSPPSDVHALLHGPEEVRGAAQVSFRPPEPLACIRHLLFVFPFCNFFQLSAVPRLSGPKRRSHETSPSIAPDSPIAGSAAFARRPPRRRPGPGTSSPSPPASPTRVARST